jgi:N-acetylglucosamine kinase-like BadF-type ATPase
MWDAFRGGPGILVIAGTGSVVWGTGVDGRTLRVGGWGHLLGDEGSGYAIGLGALRELARTADGWSDARQLAEWLMPAMGIDGFDKLVKWTTAATKREIAALAPIVLESEDEPARRVVRQAAADLAQQILTASRLLAPWGDDGVPLALSGGLIAPGRPFRDYLLAAIAEHSAAFCPLPHEVDGARGAALLARAQAALA